MTRCMQIYVLGILKQTVVVLYKTEYIKTIKHIL